MLAAGHKFELVVHGFVREHALSLPTAEAFPLGLNQIVCLFVDVISTAFPETFDFHGFLDVRTADHKQWKVRYFVLKHNVCMLILCFIFYNC